MAGFSETQSAIGQMPTRMPSGAFGMSPEMMGAMSTGGYNPIANPTSVEDSGMSMGAVMGMTQALTGLAGSFQDAANQRSALKIRQIQNRINKRFAKARFEREMTGLFQAHRDLEEQAIQAHAQRDAAYQQKMGSLKVIQAERGMAGTSASETANQLNRSNSIAEQIMIKNMHNQQRTLMYQRQGIADQRVAQELGFDMQDANIVAQLQTPAWLQALQGAPDQIIGGYNTYFNFVRNNGRGMDVTE